MADKYRVTAPSRVFGVDPGKTFERDLDPAQEARLLASGAIEKAESQFGQPQAGDPGDSKKEK